MRLADDGGMLTYLEPEVIIKDNGVLLRYEFIRSHLQYTMLFKENTFFVERMESVGVYGGKGDFDSDIYNFKEGTLVCEKGKIDEEEVVSHTYPLPMVMPTLTEFENREAQGIGWAADH